MTTSIFKFDLGVLGAKIATRQDGKVLFDDVNAALLRYDLVEIDFALRNVTPSFADECIGGVVKLHGFAYFKSHIKLINVSDDARSLLKHVISRRAEQSLA